MAKLKRIKHAVFIVVIFFIIVTITLYVCNGKNNFDTFFDNEFNGYSYHYCRRTNAA